MVTTQNSISGFDRTRSEMYEQALVEYPLARSEDIDAMKKYLRPQKGEIILGLGDGNGYFCQPLLEAIGELGRYILTDPSSHQIAHISKKIRAINLEFQVAGAENFITPHNSIDKIWSFGAFHHCTYQTQAMRKIYSALKPGGKAVICDVFQGSTLASHFDRYVARYCSSGHEAHFMSDEFARTLCFLAGFDESKVYIADLPLRWVFNSEHNLGDFIYKLHALTLFPGRKKAKIEQTVKGCKEILEIKHESGKVFLNWPMKCLLAEK